MDTNQLVAHARARFEHESARRILREKYQAKFTFAHAGGMWQAGPELLSTLKCCVMDKEVVLLDLYKNPVKINTKELWNLTAERWQECMNAWLIEYEQLNQQR
jgi:hypothetical protein